MDLRAVLIFSSNSLKQETSKLNNIALKIECVCVCFTGYGFVDFDSPAAAQKAVTALKTSGVQAQMAKVRN